MISDAFLFATGDEEDVMDDDETEEADEEGDEEKEGQEGDDFGAEEE